MSYSVCNKSSFCVNSDCQYQHNLSIKDRKIVKKLYDSLVSPDKNEPITSTRKAKCRFGQLCFNSNCGYIHFLSPQSRQVLLKKFNDTKLESTKVEKPPVIPKSHDFILPNHNSFLSLESLDTHHSPIPPPVSIPSKISWADIVCQEDDDFLMKF